jgi:hypothetical protein
LQPRKHKKPPTNKKPEPKEATLGEDRSKNNSDFKWTSPWIFQEFEDKTMIDGARGEKQYRSGET